MRALATTLAILGTALCFAACQPAEEAAVPDASEEPAESSAQAATDMEDPCALAGTSADQVMVHQAPATANAPFTVKTTPAVPAFQRSADPTQGLRFVRTPAKPTDRWERVAVDNFRDASSGSPVPPSSLSGPCHDLTGPGGPEADRCVVTFPATMEPCSIFKYDLLLYEKKDDAEPALAIDPVGIIK